MICYVFIITMHIVKIIYARKIHALEMHAIEIHALKMQALEIHAFKMYAVETLNAHRIPALELHAPKMQALKCTLSKFCILLECMLSKFCKLSKCYNLSRCCMLPESGRYPNFAQSQELHKQYTISIAIVTVLRALEIQFIALIFASRSLYDIYEQS